MRTRLSLCGDTTKPSCKVVSPYQLSSQDSRIYRSYSFFTHCAPINQQCCLIASLRALTWIELRKVKVAWRKSITLCHGWSDTFTKPSISFQPSLRTMFNISHTIQMLYEMLKGDINTCVSPGGSVRTHLISVDRRKCHLKTSSQSLGLQSSAPAKSALLLLTRSPLALSRASCSWSMSKWI